VKNKRSNIFMGMIVSLAALSLSSCATQYNKATGRNEIMFITSNAEARYGQGISKEVEKKFQISGNRAWTARVEKIGARLVNSLDGRNGLTYTFKLVKDPNLNAFTIPGGYIYVTEGLVKNIASDDQLAAVMAHEIGHSEARHAVKQMEKNMGYEALLNLGYLLDTRKAEEKKEWIYIKSGSVVAFNLLKLGYSRSYEYEADKLSLRYMKSAGYSPEAIIKVFQVLKLNEKNKSPEWLYFMRSHPYLEDRAAKVAELLNVETLEMKRVLEK
jgi:beta-barrel assembly-enhancing protease